MIECAVCHMDCARVYGPGADREYFTLETEPFGGSVFLCSVEHLQEWVRGL